MDIQSIDRVVCVWFCYHKHHICIVLSLSFLWCLQWLCDFIMNYRPEPSISYSQSRTNCFSCNHFRVKKANVIAEKAQNFVMIMFIFRSKWSLSRFTCFLFMQRTAFIEAGIWPQANVPLSIANKYVFMTPMLMSDKYLLQKTDFDTRPQLCFILLFLGILSPDAFASMPYIDTQLIFNVTY